MKLKLLVFGIAVVGLIIAAYLVWPEWFGFCEKVETTTRGALCYKPYAFEYGYPVLWPFLAFTISSALAIFATKRTYARWLKFSVYFLVIGGALFLIFLQFGVPLGFGGLALAFEIYELSFFFGVIYTAIVVPLLGISEGFERLGRKRDSV